MAGLAYGRWKSNVWPDLKPLSRKKYNGLLTNHVLPAPMPHLPARWFEDEDLDDPQVKQKVWRHPSFGELPVSVVGLAEMQALKASVVYQGRRRKGILPEDVSKRHLRSVLLMAKSILALGLALDLTAKRDWELVKVPPAPKKKVREEPEDGLSWKLLRAADKVKPWMKGPLFAASFLALRRGEAAALKWSAVDRSRNTIRIDVQRQRFEGATQDTSVKSEESERTLYVDAELIAWLDKFGSDKSGKRRHLEYIFTSTMGRPIKPDRITESMPLICEAAKVPEVTFHDLRSHAASNLADLKVDPLVIMNILGHSKLDMTLLYMNAKRESGRAAITKLLRTLTEPPEDERKSA